MPIFEEDTGQWLRRLYRQVAEGDREAAMDTIYDRAHSTYDLRPPYHEIQLAERLKASRAKEASNA